MAISKNHEGAWILNVLQILINYSGTKSKLAEMLGVEAGTVYDWQRHGIPKYAALLLERSSIFKIPRRKLFYLPEKEWERLEQTKIYTKARERQIEFENQNSETLEKVITQLNGLRK